MNFIEDTISSMSIAYGRQLDGNDILEIIKMRSDELHR